LLASVGKQAKCLQLLQEQLAALVPCVRSSENLPIDLLTVLLECLTNPRRLQELGKFFLH
jgi:hypothetical protein